MVNKGSALLELTFFLGGRVRQRGGRDNQHIRRKFQRVVSAKNKTNQRKMDGRWYGWERWAAWSRVFREGSSEEVTFLLRPEWGIVFLAEKTCPQVLHHLALTDLHHHISSSLRPHWPFKFSNLAPLAGSTTCAWQASSVLPSYSLQSKLQSHLKWHFLWGLFLDPWLKSRPHNTP